MKTTRLRFNNDLVEIESDDPAMHREFLRLFAARTPHGKSITNSSESKMRENVREFVRLCRRHKTQYGVLQALVRTGSATRDEMIKAGDMNANGKHGPLSLAGCRGSMSKNAIRLNLGKDWWTDSTTPDGKHVTTLDSHVYEQLKDVLAEDSGS